MWGYFFAIPFHIDNHNFTVHINIIAVCYAILSEILNTNKMQATF